MMSFFKKILFFIFPLRQKDITALAIGKVSDELWLLAQHNHSHELFFVPQIKSVFILRKRRKIEIITIQGEKEDISNCTSFIISSSETGYQLSYIRTVGKKQYAVRAIASRLTRFYVVENFLLSQDQKYNRLSFVENEQFADNRMIYVGTNDEIVAFKIKTKRTLEKQKVVVANKKEKAFDSHRVSVLGTISIREGVFALYDASYQDKDFTHILIGGFVTAKPSPSYVLWRSHTPIYSERLPVETYGHVRVLGIYQKEEYIHVIYATDKKGLVQAVFDHPFIKKHGNLTKKVMFDRSKENPIITPTEDSWDAIGAFNPAAWNDGELTHLFYRAVGHDGVSRIGYAVSKDGVKIDEQLTNPILQLPSPRSKDKGYDPVMYPSGGSWGGIEDPRIVEIDGRLYLSASVFDGWDFIRMAVMSIDTHQFKARCFQWNKPVFISPPGEIHKNWVLFPEKINGKFAIFHGLQSGDRSRAMIDYVSTLDEEPAPEIKSDDGFRKQKDDTSWDTMIRGAGPPPIKTDKGWLLLYHAMDQQDPDRYKLGAMLLDLEDPQRVLYRSKHAILEPDEHYENDGKPGVVYATGAVVKDGDLYVYYGGGDKVVCVAQINLDSLLDRLINNRQFLPIVHVSIK